MDNFYFDVYTETIYVKVMYIFDNDRCPRIMYKRTQKICNCNAVHLFVLSGCRSVTRVGPVISRGGGSIGFIHTIIYKLLLNFAGIACGTIARLSLLQVRISRH